MRKRYTLAVVLLTMGSLTACNPLSFLNQDKKSAETATASAVTTDINHLEDGKFYVKEGGQFMKAYIPNGNIKAEEAIVNDPDPTRVFMLQGDQGNIPVLYKDDVLAYYTTSDIPTEFTWERFKGNGYSAGLYGLQVDKESGKTTYVIGKSGFNTNSSAGKELATISLPEGTNSFTINKSGEIQVNAGSVSEAGTITGLNVGEDATLECYVGTKPFTVKAVADTEILSSMEVYKSTEYELNPSGYAKVKVPDYFLSGYYLINGKGLIQYVNKTKAEGYGGVDFSMPYYYKGDDGKTYTYPEWIEYQGETMPKEIAPDQIYTMNIENNQEAVRIDISYSIYEDRKGGTIVSPSATITDEEGNSTSFVKSGGNESGTLNLDLDRLKAGKWTINVYNCKNFKLDYMSVMKTAEAEIMETEMSAEAEADSSEAQPAETTESVTE